MKGELFTRLGGATFNVGSRRLTATWPYIKLSICSGGIYLGPVDLLLPILFYIEPVRLTWSQVMSLRYTKGTLFIKDIEGDEHNFGSWTNDAWPAVAHLLHLGHTVSIEQ